jgi:hypothetical protein
MFSTKSTHISHRKNEAELWDLPNTWTFYSKDVASAMLRLDIFPIPFSLVWTCSSGIYVTVCSIGEVDVQVFC